MANRFRVGTISGLLLNTHQARTLPGIMKIFYVLGLATILFVVRDVAVLTGLALLQLGLWFSAGLPARQLLRSLRRLVLFFIIILVSYLFITTGNADLDAWRKVNLLGWNVELNLGGPLLGLLMCLRVATLVIASGWMQRTSNEGELVSAMRALRFPELLAISIDGALALLADAPRGGGKGGGQGRDRREASLSFAEIKLGKLDFIRKLVRKSYRRATEFLAQRYPAAETKLVHDATIVMMISLVVMGLKVLQVLPGVPIASGHKNLVIVPLFLLAAHATHARFGGFITGLSVGIISFLLGYGKYGVLEIAHFAAPGLLADFLNPLLRARSRAGKLLQYALAGGLLGLARFSANLLVIILAGAPQLAFVFFIPMLISQLVFGAMSCFVSLIIVNKSFAREGSDALETENPGVIKE